MWNLWLREHDKNYETLEEENKKAGLLEYELADEYWQEQYEQYLVRVNFIRRKKKRKRKISIQI